MMIKLTQVISVIAFSITTFVAHEFELESGMMKVAASVAQETLLELNAPQLLIVFAQWMPAIVTSLIFWIIIGGVIAAIEQRPKHPEN